jgi:uncharacterized protein
MAGYTYANTDESIYVGVERCQEKLRANWKTRGLIGSIIFIRSGLHIPNLPPYSTGFIYWPAFTAIFLGSIVGSKIGIFFSNTIPDTLYGKIYCFLLVIVILAMKFS